MNNKGYDEEDEESDDEPPNSHPESEISDSDDEEHGSSDEDAGSEDSSDSGASGTKISHSNPSCLHFWAQQLCTKTIYLVWLDLMASFLKFLVFFV